MHISSKTTPTKKTGVNKLVLGFAALAATAVIGTTGVVAATTTSNKPSKEQCAAAGFKNYGQCVKEWAHQKNLPGGGYNGNINANINLNLQNSDHNVIYVIFKPIINIFN